jgi:aryl-alcohol dehydrogenase-like predicted oxidoreductase
LGGNALKPSTTARTGQQAARIEQHRAQLEAYSSFCQELGEKEANVGLAWILANPDLTGPIIGPRTVDQLNDAIRATQIHLDAAALSRLDEIFPGPGGQVPEVYAW